jgi:hypothetical protein
MDEREGYEAQQEAKRETLGKTSEASRERILEGLNKYLAAEAQHARKAAVSDKEAAEKEAAEAAAEEKAAPERSEEEDRDRRSQ